MAHILASRSSWSTTADRPIFDLSLFQQQQDAIVPNSDSSFPCHKLAASELMSLGKLDKTAAIQTFIWLFPHPHCAMSELDHLFWGLIALEEGPKYLEHGVLGYRLGLLTTLVMHCERKSPERELGADQGEREKKKETEMTAEEILGDERNAFTLQACMTMFDYLLRPSGRKESEVGEVRRVCKEVLNRFFEGKRDEDVVGYIERVGSEELRGEAEGMDLFHFGRGVLEAKEMLTGEGGKEVVI
ncbi:hypothetical protein B0T17DRAFT_637547 [Bombardia bombarda]|uniref:Uncharacterized protein n=1 Tax=Bombardia bombarda TaxID=252184 RepID=A0AA39XBJ7_9PEZI|nr:hypothetical protein B0T17DRAFT_637547 [Bombardia bombarda]